MDDEPSCWQHSFHHRANTKLLRPPANDEAIGICSGHGFQQWLEQLWPPADDGAMVFELGMAFDNSWSSCDHQQMIEQCYLNRP